MATRRDSARNRNVRRWFDSGCLLLSRGSFGQGRRDGALLGTPLRKVERQGRGGGSVSCVSAREGGGGGRGGLRRPICRGRRRGRRHGRCSRRGPSPVCCEDGGGGQGAFFR